MTSRKSSLSLAQPIQMPDDPRDTRIDSNHHAHTIEIFNNPIDQHVVNGTAMADVRLRPHADNGDGDDDCVDDKDIHLNTVLWQSGTLATWPAIDLNVLIQQTITRCTNTLNGKQKIRTAVCKHTESVDSNNSVNLYPRIDTLLANSKEIIL